MRKIFALPLLPAEHIQSTFQRLREKANGDQMTALMRYVDEIWLNSSVWDVSSWCMFGQTIRTNNNCESWHHRIKGELKKASCNFLLWLFSSTRKPASYQPRLRWYPRENLGASRGKVPDCCRVSFSLCGKITRTDLFLLTHC